ncbi:unnamed protein product [Sympodiomycopsis kandeliae]
MSATDALPPAGVQRTSSQSNRPVTGRPVSPPTSASRNAAAGLMPAPTTPASASKTNPSASASPAHYSLPSENGDSPAQAATGSASRSGSVNRNPHPPGKAATGGQSHGHRPVSAMPTPASQANRATHGKNGIDDTNGLAALSAAAYAERRASAHPTVPVPTSQSMHGLPHMAASPSIDPAFASSAISSGIPITSPAALAYFAAHPRRQQVHFGNYLLLQTLGEGEFGKVKLGVHREWGEEVAVKLIKRDKVGSDSGQLNINGPPKDPAKMSKVEREIHVLKDVRHPNIVRLYEVIESDRYIGIVLEYASGGELFDHILAHKYLKERDACRLFAQLISGVNYLHQKKIVHRDLKLENLLLDRNRNVIITDFGFANNFEDRRDDLMATSCGSPCYAAPELVVQDGLYAGSAVDVWSCGVILYAMLAGYLPFDDDPANPEGDNINLLYKYIMATPLSFPDYITAEPRDLLSRMLVPDPQKRIDLEGVMAHSWLAPYRELFKFTVDELERAAIEQQTKKRQVYRQQMVLQQQMQEHQRQQASAQRNGSRSELPATSVSVASGLAPQSVKGQRHQSAMAAPVSAAQDASRQAKAAAAGSESGVPTPFHDNTNRVHDLPTSGGADSHAQKAALDETQSARVPAGSKPQRHTIQLEYDEQQPAPAQKRRAADAQRSPKRGSSQKVTKKISAPRMAATLSDQDGASPIAEEEAVPAVPVLVPEAEKSTASHAEANGITGQGLAPPAAPQTALDPAVSTAPRAERPHTAAETGSARRIEVRKPSSSEQQVANPSARITSNPLPRAAPTLPFPHPSDRVVSASAGPSPDARNQVAPPSASKSERSAARHKKGMSTDKFFFARLLGNGGSDGPDSEAAGASERSSGGVTDMERQESVGRSGSSRRKAMSLVVGKGPDSAASRDREKASGDRRSSIRIRKESSAAKPSTPKPTAGTPSKANRPSTQQGTPSSYQGTSSSFSPAPARQTTRQRHEVFDSRNNDSNSTVGPSSGAAKKVMDWFRKKSLNKGASLNEQSPLPPFERHESNSQGARRSAHDQQGSSSSGKGASAPRSENPTVIVTGGGEETSGQHLPSDGLPSSRSTSGAYSHISNSTDNTGATSLTEGSFVNVGGSPLLAQKQQSQTPNAQAINGSASSAQSAREQTTPRASSNPLNGSEAPAKKAFNENALQYHVGAVDQSALTSRPPHEIFSSVTRALNELGIDIRREADEEFKLECVRRKKPTKSLIGATQGLGQSLRTSVFPPSQADYERSMRSPTFSGGMTSSPSGIRGFLRRGSQADRSGSPNSGTVGLPDVGESHSATIYGEPRVDGGQEVRFSVEVTRIKNLPGLYSLDIRRLRGPLTSYKFLYHNVLTATNLAQA